MKGKIIAWLIIGFIGVPLLLFFGTALVLFLAPGFEIFGIRYVAKSVVDFKEEKILPSFNGDIYIDSFDVPVNIEYAATSGVQVLFRQEYVGFTRTKEKQPSLSVKIDKNGNAKISTIEIRKFIFASDITDSYYLDIRLPSNCGAIYVDAETSNVTMKGITGNAPRVEIETEGKFKIENTMKIGTLDLTSNADVKIDSNVTMTNAIIKTGNKYISIANKVTGDLDLTNTSGSIAFNECNNLKVKTSSGFIKSSVKDGAVVNGKVDITTKSGDVKIDKIIGTSEKSYINTKTGEININYVNDIKIVSDRGVVNIGQGRNIVVDGGAGDVTIGGIDERVVVNSTNGKVVLGSNNGATITNPTVNTTTGKIYAYNTYGTVSLVSTNNLVYVKNTKGIGATKFKLSAGRELTAKNLEGDVSVYANGDVSLHFQSLTKDVNVSVGTKCRAVKIDAKCRLYDEVNYVLKSSKNKSASVYSGGTLVTRGNPVNRVNLVAAPKITVTGAYQVTTLYFE